MAEFTPYKIALLCGGPERVAQCALLALYERRRVRVSKATRRVTVVEHIADDAVQAALLDEVPDSGFPLGRVLSAVADSPVVASVAGALAAGGLVRRGVRGRIRLTLKGRAARRGLRATAGSSASTGLAALKRDAASSTVTAFAALGPTAVQDAKFRHALEGEDFKPVSLPHDWAKMAQRNSELERSHIPDGQYFHH